jgi:hypothetical protein
MRCILGAALALALGAAGPAAAQSQPGMGTTPGGLPATPTTLAGYALMVDQAAARIRAAHDALAAQGAGRTPEGTIPPGQADLVRAAQEARQILRDAPGDFRDSAAWRTADRQMQESMEAMRLTETSPQQALAEAREILASLAALRQAAANAATGAGN